MTGMVAGTHDLQQGWRTKEKVPHFTVNLGFASVFWNPHDSGFFTLEDVYA